MYEIASIAFVYLVTKVEVSDIYTCHTASDDVQKIMALTLKNSFGLVVMVPLYHHIHTLIIVSVK